ncbi:aureolysin, partial [Staphylococcus coagulans]|nr:aureolysin [Staphylococcus coagulans]
PVHSQSEAHEVLKELPSDIKKNYEDYEVVKTEKDKLGFTHYTLQPVVDGAFATDKEVKVHVNKDNKVVFVNGEVKAKKVKPTNE